VLETVIFDKQERRVIEGEAKIKMLTVAIVIMLIEMQS